MVESVIASWGTVEGSLAKDRGFVKALPNRAVIPVAIIARNIGNPAKIVEV